jgi:hypothetical protein
MVFNATFNNISVISVCGDTTQVNATLGMALRQVIDMVNCVKLSQLYYANMHMHEMKSSRVSVMVFNATFNNISVIS